jgi:hypothetical protein
MLIGLALGVIGIGVTILIFYILGVAAPALGVSLAVLAGVGGSLGGTLGIGAGILAGCSLLTGFAGKFIRFLLKRPEHPVDTDSIEMNPRKPERHASSSDVLVHKKLLGKIYREKNEKKSESNDKKFDITRTFSGNFSVTFQPSGKKETGSVRADQKNYLRKSV